MAGKAKPKAKKTVGVRPSSGNVFADLKVTRPNEAHVKAELARRICQALDEQGLNQSEAAHRLGIDQPKVSALVRGRLDGFSTDRLLRFLTALDLSVEIVVRKSRKPTPAGIQVVLQ